MMKKTFRTGALVLALIFASTILAGCQQESSTSTASQSAANAAASSEATASGSTSEEEEMTEVMSEAVGEFTLSTEAIETLGSLEKVTDNFYHMNYTLDYALDDVLTQGVSTHQELNDFASQQVLEGMPFNQQPPALGCSAFTAVTPEGDYIMGRNLDIADAQNTLVHTKPETGYESLATASGLLLGYIDHMPDSMMGKLFLLAAPYYPVDGINEKGLSATILLQYNTPPVDQDTGKISITTTLAIRMLLDKAATVEEAIELMGSYDMHSIANSNIHFQVADASGDSAVIEYVNAEMRVLRSEGNGQPVTNFFLSPDAVEEYRDGEDRLITLQAALDEGEGVVTTEKAMQMLESVKAVDDFDDLSGVNYNTSYSIVFNNSQRSLEVCANMDYDNTYSFSVSESD
ncbi:linear amide C-N hydrolase [Ruminococcaceae bacterium OttesenSCG-928-I18]|nr:linear amide C-N hydrolase [Ruminococcaceae bacterium OttesenSCG-928-I18]